jgi:hypothetical protein
LPAELSLATRGAVECEGSDICISSWLSYTTKITWRAVLPLELSSFVTFAPESGYLLQNGRTVHQAEGVQSPCSDAFVASAEVAVVRISEREK